MLARQWWGGKHGKAAAAAAAKASDSVGCKEAMNGVMVDADGSEFATMTTESRVLLSQVALRLRVALFDEIFTPTRSLEVHRPPAIMSFSGHTAVLRMLSEGFVPTEEAAAQLGNRLLLVGALCGTSGPAIFSTSVSCFFRFSVDRFAVLASPSENAGLMDGTRLGGAKMGLSFCTVAEVAQRMRSSSDGVFTMVDGGDGVRRFSGTDVVDWLMTHGLAGSEEGAVAMADALVRAGVFANVAGRCNFRVGGVQFSFAEDVFLAAVRATSRSTDEGPSRTQPSEHDALACRQALFAADCIALAAAQLWNDSVRALPRFSLEPLPGSS